MGKLMNYQVNHPRYGTVTVASIGPDSATVAAFEGWGARSEWASEVANCDVRKLGPAGKPRCRRCGQEFGKDGEPGGLCGYCAQVVRVMDREAAVRLKRKKAGDPRGRDQR